jgi:hypothetical protein
MWELTEPRILQLKERRPGFPDVTSGVLVSQVGHVDRICYFVFILVYYQALLAIHRTCFLVWVFKWAKQA